MTPFGVRMTVMLAVVVALLVAFGSFVTAQQRASDVRRAAAVAQQQARDAVQTQAVAAQATGTTDAAQPSTAAVSGLLDRQARSAAEASLAAAIQIAAAGSLDAAGPAALSAADHDLLFVDGASTAPSIVSVYTGAAGWAAAVRGAGDTCFWVAITSTGRARYGTGQACTGMAALAADRSAW